MDSTDFINAFIGLFFLTTPLAALPAVLAAYRNHTTKAKWEITLQATLASAFILLLVTWTGTAALDAIGITIPTFQVAGGLIVLLMAFSMLYAQTSPIKSSETEQESSSSSAIVPLAFPLVAGPGAISTAILNAANYPGIYNHLILSIVCILLVLSAGIFLHSATYLEKALGQTGVNIFNRLGGLILLAIGIKLFTTGIKEIFLIH